MGKRSNFERVERDFYPTPYEAVVPLLRHLPPETKFIEPCAGDGRLIRHIERHGHQCVYACDLEPQGPGIDQRDVLFFDAGFPPCDLVITNPPWDRDILHAMIRRFTDHADTWLLFDSDWMQTVQAAPFEAMCLDIVSVGRVKWIEGTDNTGMDNCSWYLFSRHGGGPPRFHFRA